MDECLDIAEKASKFSEKDINWQSFVYETQECVDKFLKRGLANTTVGAYNACAYCVRFHFSRNKIEGTKNNCREGINRERFPTVFRVNKCPFY